MNQRFFTHWRPWLFGMMAVFGTSCDSHPTDMTGVEVPPAPAAITPNVVFSEIMYHPVAENSYVDNHEFIELHNRTDSAVNLSGWQLAGAVQYTIPEGTMIAPKGYAVIAKNKSALVGVASYGLSATELLGDYAGELDNGGAVINLVDNKNTQVDSLEYHDAFPWSIGADGLGADDEWLAQLPNPIKQADHQYKGISLQRVSPDVPSREIANWVPSPLDGASPGRANTLSGVPPTIVERKLVTPASGNLLIRSADTVKISVVFSNHLPIRSPQLQWFVDDVQITGEKVTTVDLLPFNGFYEATLPKQPNNSIVRYRILVDKGSGAEVISPRPSDPLGWWAYFVTPPVNTTAPIYQVFIKKENWNQIYDNVFFSTPDDKRVAPGGSNVNRCQLRASWDATVPAVFVYEGMVYDTFVRYGGSRWNRTNGIPLDITKTTISPLPDRPKYTVFSWKINFPEYAPLEGKRERVNLNKMNQACPGLDDTLGERIYGDPSVDVPVQKATYARLHVNGGYYHYMLDLEHIDGDMMKRYRGTDSRVGDLFKADGNAGAVEGPWGVSDESPLTINATCPMWTLADRYKYTYDRQTYKWDGHTKLQAMIETVNTLRNAAVASGDFSALRAYLQANFDIAKMLGYITVRNWAQPWDDGFHNHFLYQRVSDGKWLLIPQDKDREFGEQFGWAAGRTFYTGEAGGAQYNRLKDAFIKAFRTELIARLVTLDASGPLNPATYKKKVIEAANTFSITDYASSPAAASVCSFYTELANMQTFGDLRHLDVLDLGESATCTPATCGLKAEYFQTAAGDAARDFTKAVLRVTNVSPTVNFDWTASAPDPLVPADNFQVRWTGKIVPRFTETYTLYTQSDEGVRLWVNGVLVLDKWATQPATEWSVPVNMTAGVPATIRLEYFEGSGVASAKLLWSSPTQYKQIIPTSRLRPQ